LRACRGATEGEGEIQGCQHRVGRDIRGTDRLLDTMRLCFSALVHVSAIIYGSGMFTFLRPNLACVMEIHTVSAIAETL